MGTNPIKWPCGGANQPPCPPLPCAVTFKLYTEGGPIRALYTVDEMQAHGQACYAKGVADTQTHVIRK